MALKKNAIGNLVSRYMAELKKCNLINDFGSLAVTSTLVLGGAGISSVYAAEGGLHGGSSPSTGVYTGGGLNHNVVIDGSAGTPLANGMKIYGMKGEPADDSITGSVTAKDFDSSTVKELEIWGGWSDVAGVVINGINNKVEWNDSAKVKNIKYIAGFEASANEVSATGTEVKLTGATVHDNDGKVYGANIKSTSGKAMATGTTLTLNNITTEGNNNIVGAKVEGTTSATATGTTVNMTDGVVKGDTYGVAVESTNKAEATDTTLTINGAILEYKVRGAFVKGNKDAKASDTKITMTGGQLHNTFNAAEVQANEGGSIGETNNTTLIIDNTRLTLSDEDGIVGAHVSANAGGEKLSTKNTIVKLLNLISTDKVGKELIGAHISGDTGFGGQLASAKADTTEVEMNGGKVQNVVGAMFYHTELAEAKVTTVTLNKVEADTVIGVNVTEGGTPTPIAKNATANDTTVTVTGTTVNDAIRGVNVAAVTSGNPEAKTVTANNTKLTIKDTTVGGDVTGVRVKATDTITATKTDVIIDGATLIKKSVYGVDFVGDGTATNTAVTINAGEIKESVYGVNIDGDGTAKNNTVTINNGTITGSVYGVNIKNGAAGTAANNTVIYSGGEIERDLRGGVAANSLNNTLVVIGENRKVGGSVSHFQNYRFLLPADVANNAKILEVGTSADINGANVNVEFMGTPFRLKKGDSVTLINKTTGTYIGDSFYFLPYGFLSTYDFNIAVDSSDTGLKMTLDAVTKKSDNPYATNGDGLDEYIKASQDRGEIHPVFSTDLSKPAGVRFLSRAIDPAFGNASTGAAKAVESAMNAITVAAVPQITMSANMAAVGAVTQRTSIAMPLGSMQSATLVSDAGDQSGISGGNKYDKTGFAIWIMPLWQSNKTFGMKVGDNLKTDTRASMDGIAIGADYTWDQMFRLGLTLNIGSDHAKGSGDFAKTTNNMNFWGIGTYAGWAYNNFGLTADVNYTSANNKIKQEIDSSFMMDEMNADVRSSAISAGLRGEYKFETSALDITPHVGVRFMYLTTDDYNMKSGGETVLKADSTHQKIWTFPVGVQFAKSFVIDNGWYVKPSLDLTFIPAAGDINSKRDVRFTGVSGTLSPEAKIMDRVSYGGQAGLELSNGNMKLGVIYNLQLSAHSTNQGVSGTVRYEF